MSTKRIPRIGAVVACFILLSGLLLSQADSDQIADKEYVGSEVCGACHDRHYDGWKSTLHSRMEQVVIVTEGTDRNVHGDFSSKDPDLTFTLDDVDMLVGNRFKQRYAKKIGDDYYMLPAQWNLETKEWVPYKPKKGWWAMEGLYPDQWDKRPTSKLCEGCHTTGFDIKTKIPSERSIACESCHGPGSRHMASREAEDIVNPARLDHERGNMICFQCHMSGRPPKGEFDVYAWPVGYTAGADLKRYWGYSRPTGESVYDLWADGFAHKNRVQGNTFVQSKMHRYGVSCFTCHDPHGSRNTSFTLKSVETNSLCLTCHGENCPHAAFKAHISEHTRHTATGPGSICIECHMPKTGKNAVKWDSRDHRFTFISPLVTTRFGTPNGCVDCHADKTPEWALKEVTEWRFTR